METMQNEKTTGPTSIIRDLGDLPADAVVTEEGLAKIMGKCRTSVKRAVKRGELPVPVRMFGEPVWTVAVLRDHLNRRLEEAKRDRERLERRISQLSP